MNIKIIRLKSGDDVIASIENDIHPDSVVLYYPMQFHILDKGGVSRIILAHFLPHQLIEENLCVLNKSDVLFYLEPNEEFTKYYVNSVEKLIDVESQPATDITESLMDSLMNMDQEQMIKH